MEIDRGWGSCGPGGAWLYTSKTRPEIVTCTVFGHHYTPKPYFKYEGPLHYVHFPSAPFVRSMSSSVLLGSGESKGS